MGVGLQLKGRYPSSGEESAVEWLFKVKGWLESRENEPLIAAELLEDEQSPPTLLWQIHPCAEEVALVVHETNLIELQAKTSTIGAGYHVFLCDLIKKLSQELEIQWDPPSFTDNGGDDTGYFFTGQAEGVRRDMLGWLQRTAQLVGEGLKRNYQHLMIALPYDRQFDVPGAVLTPLGPRSAEWFERVARDPREGLDFFAWWKEGVGAEFFRGRALCRLWQEVPWRPPVTEDEGELLQTVHSDLERAYQLDPQADYPWREWAALLGYIKSYFGYVDFQGDAELGVEIHQQAGRCTGPLVGYRRYPVRVQLTGGWSIRIAGEFAQTWENDGENWVAWLGNRGVWFTSLTFQKEDGSAPEPGEILEEFPLPAGEQVEFGRDNYVGAARVEEREEEGKRQWQLQGHVALPGHVALVTIHFESPAERDWAIATWRSLEKGDEP